MLQSSISYHHLPPSGELLTSHCTQKASAPPFPLVLTLFWRSRRQQGSPLCVCRHRRVDGHHAVVCCQEGDGRVPEKQVPKRIISPRNASWNSELLHVMQSHLPSCRCIFSPCSWPGLGVSGTSVTSERVKAQDRAGLMLHPCEMWSVIIFDLRADLAPC